MVWALQLRKSQKAALVGIFSLGLVVAIFDILCTVEILRSETFSRIALWSSLEVTVAVIVASLPLYRVLLTQKGRIYLVSRGSAGRYKTISNGPSGVERQRADNGSWRRKKLSLGTIRDGLETQNLTLPDDRSQVQHFPLAHLSH
jgi:hypothetical protein